MKSSQRPSLSADEQAMLDGVTLRWIESTERNRFDSLLVQQHYLHAADLVGEQLRYVAEYQGQWVALFLGSTLYSLQLTAERGSLLSRHGTTVARRV